MRLSMLAFGSGGCTLLSLSSSTDRVDGLDCDGTEYDDGFLEELDVLDCAGLSVLALLSFASNCMCSAPADLVFNLDAVDGVSSNIRTKFPRSAWCNCQRPGRKMKIYNLNLYLVTTAGGNGHGDPAGIVQGKVI